MASPARSHAGFWRRYRTLAEGALWTALIVGGILFFFYLIWNPPR